MTEHQFSLYLTNAIRRMIPGAVVTKFNDRVTKGIPDFCVVCHGRTTWFESKLKDGSFPILQFEILRRMQRGWYVVWNVADRRGHLLRPIYDGAVGEVEMDVVGEVPFERLASRICTLSKEVDP